MKKVFKKVIASIAVTSVAMAAFITMSVSAYSGTYIGEKTTTKITDMGYSCTCFLAGYSHEVYAKTSVKSGPPVTTFVKTWGSTGSTSSPTTVALEEQIGNGGVYVQTVRSSVTYIGGASYHYVDEPGDTKETIKVGSNNMTKVNGDIKNIESDFE